jgi:iron complex outermembrane receptor protein
MVRFIIRLFFISLVQSYALAQGTASLQGHIHAEDGTPAAGATIIVKELKAQTRADDNGHFIFKNIPAGSYTLTATLVGYEPLNSMIKVSENNNADIHLSLRANSLQLQPVVVTAEKRESDLQAVPMAVSAISGKQIERRKITEVGDLLLSVPNLMTMNDGAPSLSTIAIRGILTFSTDPAVGVYVDGVPMFDGYSSSLQFQNLERIEVLRGPQSTLYGRNALGGIINIITRKPDNALHGFAEAGISSYGGQRYGVGLSGPIVKHKLFAGFSGLYDTRNGFYTNLYNNKKYDKPETWNGNTYLKYLVSDKFSLTLNAKGEYNNIRGAFPYVVNADSAFKYPYTINQDGTNLEKRKLYTASLTAQYKTKSTQFSSTTAYTYLSDTYENYDADYSPYNMVIFEMPLQKQKTFTQDFRMTSDYGKHIKLTAGIFGFIDTKPSQTVYKYGEDAAMIDPNAPYTSNIYAERKIYGIAGYANLDYAINDQWTVTGGLRYDYDSRNISFSTDFVKPPDPPMVITPEQKLKGNDKAFSPKLSVSFKPGADKMIYATYARGFHAGGFNQYTSDPDLLNYKPEYTDNFELGFKSEWFNHRLRANAALFYTDWKDQQQTLMLPQNATENVGRLVNKGAELELTGLLAKGLELNYNLGIVQSEYKTLILPDDSGSDNKNYKGNKQVFTPAFTSAISLSYRYSFNDHSSLYISPEWKYLGKQYMTYYNDLVQDPFSLINASLGFQYRFMEVSLWAKNIGDARYLAFAYATQTRATSPVLLGMPRTYGVTLKARF